METIKGLDQWISQMIESEQGDSHRDFTPFFEAISERVAYFLDQDPDLLMSYLYRLDVDEARVRDVMRINDPSRIIRGIAKLIFDRQIERLRTKREYGINTIDEEGWEW